MSATSLGMDGSSLFEPLGPVLDDLVGDFRGVPAMKRQRARGHGVHHAPEAKQIAPRIHLSTTDLLGRHVRGRADGVLEGGQFRGFQGDAGQAEIGDLDTFDPVLEHDVGRFDVAVYDALLLSRKSPAAIWALIRMIEARSRGGVARIRSRSVRPWIYSITR